MTLLDIETDVLSRCNYDTSSVNATVKARIDRFINQRYHQLLSMPGLSRLRDATTTFDSVGGTAVYALPAAVARINAVYTTGPQRLTQRTLDWLRTVEAIPSSATRSEVYIPITIDASHKWSVQLWPTPAAAVTYSVDYTSTLSDLSGPTDEPLLPPDFHYLLATGARMDEYEKLNDARYGLASNDWKAGVPRLLNYVINTPDYIVVPGGNMPPLSNLGPWYPSGA